ncbi:MAG TPA: TonB-dependent receptor, partial [Bryobacteraceae bacterium]|nr:TonB-dependent receptor [Bryobacteraceae bacterium]
MKSSLFPVVLCVCVSGGLFAQTAGSGSIAGTVTDPTGSVIPAASVVVHNADTNIDQSLTTNDAGIYVATFLQPGHYDVTASKTGFSTTARKNLVLQVGRTLTIDFALTVQSGTETVTVTSESPVVDTDKTEVSQIVSENAVKNLPINGRRWDAFVLLTPNVTTDGGTGLVSYRGISGLYNNNTVDGANNQQAFFSESKGRTVSGVPYVYSLDSIQEFQVSAANYSAEFGQAAGGQVNAVTKSGGNQLTGDLFYYLRYPSLNALDPLNKSFGNYTQPTHQQQQFGGSVGGPIIKDKLFYFFTYDGSRKVNPISYLSTSNFPQTCAAAISAATCAAANAYATALLGSYPRNANQDVGFGKLDYQLNDRNHLNASFNMDNFRALNSYSSSPTVSNSSLSANGTNIAHERIFVASWDSTFTSATINNLRFQWSRDLESTSANGAGPSVSVANVLGYGLPNALPRPAFPDEHRIQISDVLSMNRGRHTIKAGFDVNSIHEVLINLFQGGGVYNYTGANAFSNWVADVTGTNLGDNLTGRHFGSFVQVTDPVTGVGKDDFYDNDIDGFVEDTWKARPNLTVNLGLRYDIQLIPQPPKPNTTTPLTTLYTSTINIDKKELAPRLGLAWSLGQNTVIRAGYGIFYAKTSNSTYYATRVENGSFQQTYNCTPSTCPQLTFPNLIFTPPGGAPAAPFTGALTPQVVPFKPGSNTATTRGQSPDWLNPRVHEGEVTVEHRLRGNIAVSAGYVVSRGLRLPIFVDANLAPSTTTRSYDVTNRSGA